MARQRSCQSGGPNNLSTNVSNWPAATSKSTRTRSWPSRLRRLILRNFTNLKIWQCGWGCSVNCSMGAKSWGRLLGMIWVHMLKQNDRDDVLMVMMTDRWKLWDYWRLIILVVWSRSRLWEIFTTLLITSIDPKQETKHISSSKPGRLHDAGLHVTSRRYSFADRQAVKSPSLRSKEILQQELHAHLLNTSNFSPGISHNHDLRKGMCCMSLTFKSTSISHKAVRKVLQGRLLFTKVSALSLETTQEDLYWSSISYQKTFHRSQKWYMAHQSSREGCLSNLVWCLSYPSIRYLHWTQDWYWINSRGLFEWYSN